MPSPRELIDEASKEHLGSALRELALRLAWYVDKHGAIPEDQIRRLFLVASGISRNPDGRRVRALADEIVVYALEDLV